MPLHTIYAEYTPEQRLAYELNEGMIRLSVGIEDVEDLLEDIDQALYVETVELSSEPETTTYAFDV